MRLTELVKLASNKTNFTDLSDYFEFCEAFWGFTAQPGAIQAEIVSRNETQYRFLQFKEDGSFNVTRPLNYNLLYPGKAAKGQIGKFLKRPQSWVFNCETGNRRVDVAEFCDWCRACNTDPANAIRRLER